jgi:SAM-dependent methyltransferase
MTDQPYVHGYSPVEQDRLIDQANVLAQLLHHDTRFPAGSSVLEAGCGVGAQTVLLAEQSPGAHITAVDLSIQSLEAARARVKAAGFSRIGFCRADVTRLPFGDGTFDHVFVCFVLEHLREPLRALSELSRVLVPGGTVTVVEGDHGSAYFYPAGELAQQTIDCLTAIQSHVGGNALIGRALFPLLRQAGFADVRVSPRVVYADGSRPNWVEGFTKNTFVAMVKGARAQALALGLMQAQAWDEGIAELERTAGADGTFNYTFFKAVARKA